MSTLSEDSYRDQFRANLGPEMGPLGNCQRATITPHPMPPSTLTGRVVCPTKDRTHIHSSILFFFLIAEMNTPSAFDSAIRYSVPQHQRSAFDRAIAALPLDFLRFLVTREVFGSM